MDRPSNRMKPQLIRVVNPSDYEREDLIEVELVEQQLSGPRAARLSTGVAESNPLVVPHELTERNLRLVRVWSDREDTEVPFQIDMIFGVDSHKRILTFNANKVPPGDPDYRDSGSVSVFRLEERAPAADATALEPLKIDHYYQTPGPGEPVDGFNPLWIPGRRLHTVKVRNGLMDIAIRLFPVPSMPREKDLAGAVCSVCLGSAQRGPAAGIDMLTPFGPSGDAKWGQLTKLVFFPLPWELQWFHEIDLLGKPYDLIWSHVGPLRAVVTLRSEPFTIRYRGAPLFVRNEPHLGANYRGANRDIHSDEVELPCRLYRVIQVQGLRPFYVEDVFVLADKQSGDAEDLSISFRPYFRSFLNFEEFSTITKLARFEHIPDYFALWQQVGPAFYGYGFASDAHARSLSIDGKSITWRLPASHRNRCVHYFMSHFAKPFDPFHEIGHFAWYEKVLKPLEAVPLRKRYPSPLPETMEVTP